MKTREKVLIGIVAGLILLILLFGYRDIKHSGKLDDLETQIAKTEVVIAGLKSDLIKQGEVSDSLLAMAREKDSLIVVKEGQIDSIRTKYNKIKNKVKELSKEEAVIYLGERLRYSPNYINSKYPILVEYDKTPIVMIDTNETRQINLTYVELDAKTEELDTTKELVGLQKEQISDLYKTVDSQQIEIGTCKDIVANQDTLIGLKDGVIAEKDKAIKKLDRRNKIKSYVISTLGGVAAVLGILLAL